MPGGQLANLMRFLCGISQPTAEQPTDRQLLARFAEVGADCRELERLFGANPPPELETLLKLHRVLALKFSLGAETSPDLLKYVKELMTPVMEWARLQEKRKDRELAERKHREQLELQKSAREVREGGGVDALTPETLSRIERELNLL